MPQPLTDAINALTTYANTVTGASDTTLSDAVATLASGYGGGGDPNENLLKLATNTLTNVVLDVDGVSMKERTFNTCTALLTLKILNFGGGGQYIAYNCSNLATAVIIEKTSAGLPQNTFLNCSKLETADMTVSSINQVVFSGCSKLDVLVLRHPSVTTLSHINAFNNSPFASGKAGGTLYVPNDLISTYQSANNWSTILGYASNSIKSIESTHTDPNAPIDLTLYYADGTPIQ